jgi:hypothetical protein
MTDGAGAEVTGTEEMTDTEGMTDTDGMTDGAGITDTEGITGTEDMTDTDGMTDTEGPADTDELTDTEGITDTEELTDSEAATGTEALGTGDVADTTAAAAGMGVVGAEGGQVYATTLLDYNFENADGDVSGEIEDIFVDMSSGEVLFVPIEYGGFLELGDTDIVLPLNAFKIGEEGELVLNFDEAELSNYPDMGDNWPDLNDPAWDDDINAFWTGLGIGHAADFSAATTNVIRASELIGYAVADLGSGAGSVEDMIIDLGTGKATYVLVNFGAAGTEDSVYAVPFSAFNLEERGDSFIFNADISTDTFANAPRFDRGVYVPGEPLDPTWRDDFDTFWGDLGFDIGNDAD